MSTNTTWSAIDVEFWADIDGTEVECVATTFTYRLNAIPTANFSAAVGRDAHSGAAATAHALADTKIMTPVQLYAKFNNRAGEASVAMPVGKKLVFDGYVMGVGMSRGTDSYTVKFFAVHWLVDLTYGSVLSATSHPTNPADLAFNANWGENASSDTSGSVAENEARSWNYSNSANGKVDEEKIAEDLWGAALQPWLLALVEREEWGIEGLEGGADINAGDLDEDPNTPNDPLHNDVSRKKAKDALEKIESDPALAFAEGSAHIAKKIADDITCQSSDLQPYTLKSLAITDFWSLLISLSTSYCFSIVPFPDKVKVVPFIAGYRTHFKGEHALDDFSIAARDLSNIDLALVMPRRLGGIVVIGSPLDATHAMNTTGTNRAVIGKFIPSPSEPGMIALQEAPRWLNGGVLPTAAGSAMGLSGNVTSNGVAHPGDTGSSELSTAGTAAEDNENKAAEALQKILTKYAQSLYCNEMLCTRRGRIVGPLRLDICPGSTIKFEGVSEKYTPGTQPIGHARFAHVTGVTCVLDAQDNQVKTIYDVSHIRTEKENADDAMSIDGHPLYAQGWSGDALI